MRNSYWYGRLMSLKSDKNAKLIIKKSRESHWRSAPVHQLLEFAWDKSLQSNELSWEKLEAIYAPIDSKRRIVETEIAPSE